MSMGLNTYREWLKSFQFIPLRFQLSKVFGHWEFSLMQMVDVFLDIWDSKNVSMWKAISKINPSFLSWSIQKIDCRTEYKIEPWIYSKNCSVKPFQSFIEKNCCQLRINTSIYKLQFALGSKREILCSGPGMIVATTQRRRCEHQGWVFISMKEIWISGT